MSITHRFVPSVRALLGATLCLALAAPFAAAAPHHKPAKPAKPAPAPAPAPTPAPDAAPTPAPAPGGDAAPTPTPAPGDNGGPAAGGAPDKLPEKGRAPTDEELAKNKAMNERPWAVGVPESEQREALKDFADGNALIHDALFVKAADKYREALGHWKHPAIYYNLALALVNLDKPVEMYDALEKAMAYGAAPLDEDKYERAKGYKILVEGQLSHVELTCDQPGAKVYLDGEELFTAPGKYAGLVIVGEHTVVAKGAGFAPTQLSQKLGPRETMRLNLKLFTDEELTRYHRKFPSWIPYAVAGAGVLFAGVGGLMEQQSSSEMKTYDSLIATCAMTDPTHGCSTAQDAKYADKKSGAQLKQTIATSGFILGGAAVAAAVVLYVIDRPESYRIDPFAEKQPAVSVTPVFGPDGGGIAATVHF